MDSAPIIYVVDDDQSVCSGVKRLLNAEGYKVETFQSAKEFLEYGRFEGPGCVVLDVNMPGLSGLDLQQELNNSGVMLPCIFMTAYGSVPITVKAMQGGASDFLEKPFDDEKFVTAIFSAVEKSRSVFSLQEEEAAVKKHLELLTSRETEILKSVITGKLNKQIASELGIKENTVKVHRKNMMDKLGVQSVADLVRLVEKAGME